MPTQSKRVRRSSRRLQESEEQMREQAQHDEQPQEAEQEQEQEQDAGQEQEQQQDEQAEEEQQEEQEDEHTAGDNYDDGAQISTTVRILRKRPCGSTTAEQLRPALTATRALHAAFERRVHELQQGLQRRSFERVLAVVQGACHGGATVPSICLNTGTSSTSAHQSLIDAIHSHFGPDGGVSTIRLNPVQFDSLKAVTNVLSGDIDEDEDDDGDETQKQNKQIIMLENAHLFHHDLLSDIIYIVSKQNARRVLLFVVPNAQTLFGCLNLADLNVLDNTVIDMPTQREVFDAIVQDYRAASPVLPTASVFQMLQVNFIHFDSSIATVTTALHQLLSLHLHGVSTLAPVVPYLTDADEQHLPQLLKSDPSISQELCKLPSVRQSGDKTPSAQHCVDMLRRLVQWKRRTAGLIQMSFELERDVLNNYTMASITEYCSLYAYIFSRFLPNHRYPHAMPGHVCLGNAAKFIKTCKKDDLRNVVHIIRKHSSTFNDLLSQSPSSTSPTVHTTVQERADEILRQLDSNEAEADTGCAPADTPQHQPSSKARFAKGSGAARQRRAAMLLQNVSGAQQPQQQSHKARCTELCARLLEDVYKQQQPLLQIPCHELVLFSDVDTLRMTAGNLAASMQPRYHLFETLRQPMQKKRRLPIIHENDNNVPVIGANGVPDLSVAFRILAQGGRLVSLYDWYKVFHVTVSDNEAGVPEEDENGIVVMKNDGRKVKDKDKDNDKDTDVQMEDNEDESTEVVEEDCEKNCEIQARFARACSELEFLGLMKYTNRKADHVARLAYE